jgi:hypothetical protein
MREQIGIDVTARDLASKELARVNGAVDKLAASTGKAVPATNALGGAQMGMAQKAFFALQNLQSVQWAISMATSVMQPMVDAARDYQESLTKINTVLGEHAQLLITTSETSARTMGLSTNQVLKMGGEYANLFRAMKLSEEESANMSLATIQLASDISSFNNIPMDDALGKLRSGLVGEYLPMRTVGVQMNELVVGAKGVELGFAKTAKELTAQQKVMARMAVMTEQLDLTVGDFARTQYGLANQQRIAAAVMEDNMMKAGQALVPIFLSLTQATIGLMEVIIPIIVVLGTQFPAIAGGVVAALIFMAGGFIPAAAAAWAFVSPLLMAAVAAAPFIIVGALVAGLLMLLEEKFGFVTAAINVFFGIIGAIADFIKSVFVVAIQIVANIIGIFDQGLASELRGVADNIQNLGEETTEVVKATEEDARMIVARGIPGMENIAEDYFDSLPDAAGKAKEAVLTRTSQLVAGVADSLQAGRDSVKDAAAALKDAIANAVTPKKEKADLNKFLNSKELQAALKSTDAIVRARALAAQSAAKERLFALEKGVPDAAVDANINYDDAYKAAAEAEIAALVAAQTEAQDIAGAQFEANMFRWGERTMLSYAEGLKLGGESAKITLGGVMSGLVPLVIAKSPPTQYSPLHKIDTWGERTMGAFGDGMKNAGAALRDSARLAIGATRPAFAGAAAMGISNAASSGSPLIINNNFTAGSVRKDEDIRRITERIHVQARLRGGLHGGGASAISL